MNRFFGLIAATLFSFSAHAGQPTEMPFPGAKLFPAGDLGSDDALLRRLYEGRLLVPGENYPNCKPDCTLTPKGRMSWIDDRGYPHVGFVVAAEPNPDDAAHADGAYIGMVDLVQSKNAWVINAGSPIVASTNGSFGQAPPVELIRAGKFGMAVIVKPAYSNQGEVQQTWDLYIQVHDTHEFKQVLSIPMLEDNSGKCDDDQCRSHDFTTDIVISDEGNRLYVRVTKHPYVGVSTFTDHVVVP